MQTIYLASGSPRRREILENLGYTVLRLPAEIDETPFEQENAQDYVERMAREKNTATLTQWRDTHADEPVYPILTADTTVAYKGQILGKPESEKHAAEMLSMLSDSTHQVLTAVCIYWKGQTEALVQQSDVRFRKIDEEEIEAYVACGEPMDKAGAYGIQGLGGIFVDHLHGSFTGVMGLPVSETALLLKKLGLTTPPFSDGLK
ncbi:Maf family protein [Neisseria weaveri]|nr:nucleoside triphosphate pyrophosphatase [Neisseria weaveri]